MEVGEGSMGAKKSFKGVLEPLTGGLGWTIVRLPFDATKVWPERKRMQVKGTIRAAGSPKSSESHVFRTSLFGISQGGGQMLLVNKQMQKGAKVTSGSLVEVVLEPDMEERRSSVPVELERLLKTDRGLKKFYEALSPSARNDISKTITEPKSADARVRRAEQMAERMMLAMEGERDLPPILQVAFRRHPLAKVGWEAMTQVQRRSHLLGIFYYQSPEAREKRAGKTVEEALKVAGKKK